MTFFTWNNHIFCGSENQWKSNLMFWTPLILEANFMSWNKECKGNQAFRSKSLSSGNHINILERILEYCNKD